MRKRSTLSLASTILKRQNHLMRMSSMFNTVITTLRAIVLQVKGVALMGPSPARFGRRAQALICPSHHKMAWPLIMQPLVEH